MPSTPQILALVGALVVLKSSYSLLRLASVYFLPSSRLKRFQYGPASYALVTGASDGIGRAVAKELYRRGFNLILHGRNPEKLARVQEEIEAASTTKRDIKLWVADANDAQVDFEGAVKQWEDLQITLVVHNVGGAPAREFTIDSIESSALLSDIQRNAVFPLLLTRALLPKLRHTPGPVELVYCGSLSSRMPIPRIIPYGATKAFLRQLSGALASDEHFRAARPPNVSTIYMDIGSVQSGGHKVASSLMTPPSDTFAKHFVHCIGCGLPSIIPYWWHAVQTASVVALPAGLLRSALFEAMEHEIEASKKTD